jgi:hypothetical protein
MDQRQWEQRLDRAAARVSGAVTQGVHILEDAFDKGKDTLKDELGSTRSETATGSAPAAKGSPKLGLALVAVGIIWLLHSLGILRQPVFPILLIILGVYFIVRAK